MFAEVYKLFTEELKKITKLEEDEIKGFLKFFTELSSPFLATLSTFSIRD